MYSTDSRSLEPVARFLPPEPMAIFVKAANDMAQAGGEYNDHVMAGWEAVKAAGWERPKQGKRWVKKDQPLIRWDFDDNGNLRGKEVAKDNPNPADVHVDGPMGEKKPKKKPLQVDGNAGADDEEDTLDKAAFETTAQVCKVDESLGLVFGFAIVCKIDGKPYWDLQRNPDTGEPEPDHIPEPAMLKAAAEFMQAERISGDMHARSKDNMPVADGQVVFAFPLTTDIAKALDIETRMTGLLIAIKPSADVLAKYKNGEYRGFSIGGLRVEDEEIED